MGRSKWINKKKVEHKLRPAAQNPKVTKFRDLAKSNNSMVSKPKTMELTEENLAIHDFLMQEKMDSDIKNEDLNSEDMPCETELIKLKGYQDDKISEAQTFATSFTNCTNQTFSYFLKKFSSSSNVHKEMLSILAAETEILQTQNEEESDEKYFELLMQSIYTAENTLALTANMVLLNYVIKKLKPSFLIEKFSEFQKLTNELIKKYLNASNVSFIKFLIRSYFIFLENQEFTEWENSITKFSYIENLLILIVHPKSRIRKVAKDSVIGLFNKINDQNCDKTHPIYETTINFCTRKVKDTSGEDITEALYVLNLYKEIIHLLPENELKLTCEQLISLLSLGNTLIFTNCMQILENLFKKNSKHLNQNLNYKLIIALYDNQPSINEHQPLLAWCSVTKYAELNLIKLDQKHFTDHFLKLVGIYFSFFDSENQTIRSFACQSINELLVEAINIKDKMSLTVFKAIAELIKNFLSYKYATIWRLTLKICATFFKLEGDLYKPIIDNVFSKVLEIKDSNCDESLNIKLDFVIKNLIISQGVEFVLDRIKLEPDMNNFTVSNIWLIEILRQSIKNEKICNFNNYILVQINKICPDLNNYTINNESPWLFSYVQLWSLLPVFLNEPTDILTSFKSIARTLGDGLNNAHPIRIFILKSLRQLISKSKDDDLKEVSKFAKNYIPILLNLYISDLSKDKAMKTTIYQTLIMFFSIADQELIENLYEKVFENKNIEKDLKKLSLYFDILRGLICVIKDEQKIIRAFEESLILIKNKTNKHEQKKGLRLMEEIIKTSSYNVINNYYLAKGESFYDNMMNFYSQNYASVSVFAAQASFNRIIEHVLQQNFKDKPFSEEEFRKILKSVVDILQSKKSAKLSISAFNLVNCCIKFIESGSNLAIKIFIEFLNDSDVDRKATIFFVLHNVLLNFQKDINSDTKELLIKSLLNNLSNENRKIVNVILLFIHDWFKVSDKDEMLKYVVHFINYLNSIEKPDSPIFKYKIKSIIEKILKKFGPEMVTKMLNEKYRRLVRIMLKKERREKRNGKESSDESNSEDEIDVNDKKEFKKNKSNKRWKFDEEEDFEGFPLFDYNEMEAVDDDQQVVEKTKKPKQVTFSDILKINKEGEIVNNEDEIEIDKKQSDNDSESDDDQKNKKINKKKDKAELIMSKYRRKRGIYRETGTTGKEYKSKRAGGDMKKKGRPDPYAFIPLDKSVLSKRKAVKNKTKFQNVIKSALRGVSNASKNKFKKHKKN